MIFFPYKNFCARAINQIEWPASPSGLSFEASRPKPEGQNINIRFDIIRAEQTAKVLNFTILIVPDFMQLKNVDKLRVKSTIN